MASFKEEYVVLIHSIVKTTKEDVDIYGTGYLVTKDLILTANHVLAEGEPEIIEVRLPVKIQGLSSNWVEAKKTAAWKSDTLDAALIKLVEPLPYEVSPPVWGDIGFQDNVPWKSIAYPEASSVETDDGTNYKIASLFGKVCSPRVSGQSDPEIVLCVDYAADFWQGISGAPVFVQGKLVGIIQSSLTSYGQKRLVAVPTEILRQDPDFTTALMQEWPYPAQETDNKIWTLILNPEKEYNKLKKTVLSAIKAKKKEIQDITKRTSSEKIYSVSITEALKSPDQLYLFIKAICAAPIMVFDVTDFEPGVMMFLGIRAVVRRGITLTATTKFPSKTMLTELPFNIQETKLIDLSEDKYTIADPRYPDNWIGKAITDGLFQLQNDPNYIDLPAYNPVRCSRPKDLAGISLVTEKMLMLCSFHKFYNENHWDYVSKSITLNFSPKRPERMIDISSPKLVGLALYESIRWTPCCIIDWTQWRANVFFEFGVRLACSDIGAVCIIDEVGLPDIGENSVPGETHPGVAPGSSQPLKLVQQSLLIKLFNPIYYKLDEDPKPFEQALNRYEKMLDDQDIAGNDDVIRHNSIYRFVVNSYYWQQEAVSRLPHEELIANIQVQFGKDSQKKGNAEALFSANPEFAKELKRNVQERWIAAWYYYRNRFTMPELKSDPLKQQQLIRIGNEAYQWLKNVPEYERIFKEIDEVLEKLKRVRVVKPK